MADLDTFTDLPQPPASHRRALIPIFLIVAVDIMGFSIMMPLLPFYVERTGASAFTVGVLISTFALCQLLAGPVLGQLSDRIGRKPVLLVSQLGTFAGLVLLALTNTLWVIFLARVIDGLTAGNISVAQAYVSDNTPPERRTEAFGVIGAAFGLGMLVGPAISGVLARRSLHAPIWAACVLSFLSIVATAVLLPKGAPARQAPGRRDILPFRAARECFAAPSTARLFTLLTLFYFAFSTFVSGLALFLAARVTWRGHFLGPQSAGIIFAYAGFLNILVQSVLLKRIIRFLSENRVLMLGFLFMACGYAGLALSHTLAILLAFLTLNNIGAAVLRPVITSQISKNVPPQRQGIVMGVNQAVMASTGIIAPLLTGALIDHALYSTWALWAATVAAVGTVTAFALRTTSKPVNTPATVA